jgi:aryl-alcohol dehydrogenase-like predicted oxidoreductase
MAEIATSAGLTIAQLSIGWVLSQAGVTGALVGARRAEQVKEIAAAAPLERDVVEQIDQIVKSHSGA